MGNKDDTKKILDAVPAVLNTLVTLAEMLGEPKPSVTKKTAIRNQKSVKSNDELFEELQKNLKNATGRSFSTKYSYAWNNANTSPTAWDHNKANIRTYDEFVSVPADSTDLVQAYINNVISPLAPTFCRDEARNDLVNFIVETVMQALPADGETGFLPICFSKTYNNTAPALPAAVRLDSTMYYTAVKMKVKGKDGKERDVLYLFLYFCGIYYSTSVWQPDPSKHWLNNPLVVGSLLVGMAVLAWTWWLSGAAT